MAKFEVNLTKEEFYSGSFIVEADTFEAAQKMVDDQIYCDDLDVDWEADNTDISVDSIDPYTDDESIWEVVVSVDNKIVGTMKVEASSEEEAIEVSGFTPSPKVLVSAVKVGAS